MHDLIRRFSHWILKRAVVLLVVFAWAGIPTIALAGEYVSIYNRTRPGSFMFQVGDSFYLHIWGTLKGAPVFWSDPRMGSGKYLAGFTDVNGDFTLEGTPGIVDIGPWQMTWYVGAIWTASPNPLRFWATSYQDPAVVPSFYFWPWNDGGIYQNLNNCYNYGANTITWDYAQPGYWGTGTLCVGYPPVPCINVDEFYFRILADGFRAASAAGYGGYDAVCPAGTAKMALMIWPENDFHFYRQDANGWWSHKPGQQAAKTLDSSYHSIYNPEWADTYPYTQFGGIFCVPHSSNRQGFSAATIAGIGAP
jgi:hypothetical protein